MSDQEVTRWQHNRIYPQPTHIHKSLRMYKRFDLPFTNFHIDYDFKIVLYAIVVKLIVINFWDLCSKQAILETFCIGCPTMVTF